MSNLSYRDSGVDIDAGARAVELMKEHVARTRIPGVLGGIGGFGGAFQPDLSNYKKPVLVSGTDGVGTKLKLAFMMDKHDTVGIDCVAMCVNDIACMGAVPLFFLDYIATGRLDPEKVADIVKGISDGCCEAGCALIGGETAEMPGFYSDGEYDMAGFAVGVVDRDQIIDGHSIEEGDLIIGIPSSGVHSNGFSLVRSIVFNKMGLNVDSYIEEFGCTLGEELLKPTRIYVNQIKAALRSAEIKGIVHVTGGGFIDNIPRVIPGGLTAGIELGSWEIPAVFRYLQKNGNVETEEMFRTFNMGMGLVMVVSPKQSDRVLEALREEKPRVIGRIFSGTGGVELWNTKE
ncbi:MAG: Phosphoribosylformylglycinamidine cyclo-ligase [Firmicutes bacterium]|nr:Phosphoribosylformylglycinamidine cyclo-ligase [Bacillota bacterium]MDI6706166.1 phosphoribosylformylglycinamidine cyclo-ligase [Bacillota bacterium]